MSSSEYLSLLDLPRTIRAGQSGPNHCQFKLPPMSISIQARELNCKWVRVLRVRIPRTQAAAREFKEYSNVTRESTCRILRRIYLNLDLEYHFIFLDSAWFIFLRPFLCWEMTDFNRLFAEFHF